MTIYDEQIYDERPLPRSYERRTIDGGYEVIPAVPIHDPFDTPHTMPYSGWLDYNTSGSTLSPREWWREKGRASLESASADEVEEDQLWTEE